MAGEDEALDYIEGVRGLRTTRAYWGPITRLGSQTTTPGK